jgi:hypothetical protein
MKTLRGMLLCMTAILALQMATHLWWWVLAVPLVYGALACRSGWEGLRVGILGAGMLWLAAAAWQLTTSAQIVSERVAVMLQVGSPLKVLAATVLLVMIAGGLAGATGASLKGLLRPARSRTRS